MFGIDKLELAVGVLRCAFALGHNDFFFAIRDFNKYIKNQKTDYHNRKKKNKVSLFILPLSSTYSSCYRQFSSVEETISNIRIHVRRLLGSRVLSPFVV